MAILQSNMGEEITNGVSDVLKELYGVLELMTGYILGGVGVHCDGVGRVDMEGGGSTRSGLRLKVVKMVFSKYYLHSFFR